MACGRTKLNCGREETTAKDDLVVKLKRGLGLLERLQEQRLASVENGEFGFPVKHFVRSNVRGCIPHTKPRGIVVNVLERPLWISLLFLPDCLGNILSQ